MTINRAKLCMVINYSYVHSTYRDVGMNDVRGNCYVTTCYKQINSAPGDCALMKILTCREPLVDVVET